MGKILMFYHLFNIMVYVFDKVGQWSMEQDIYILDVASV